MTSKARRLQGSQPPRLIAVMGPTGSGKTEVGEALAGHLDAQLINADAFQVFRCMDIGTAKPVEKHLYRLLDLKEPNEGFSVGEFVDLATPELEQLFEAGRNAVVVGGSGLYIRALFEQYADLVAPPAPELRAELMEREALEGKQALAQELADRAPAIAAKTDLANPVRVRRALERLHDLSPRVGRELPPFMRTKFILERDKFELNSQIELRLHRMVQNGWLEEVESLKRMGYGPGDPGFRALGYSAMWQHLAGTVTLNEALESTVTQTRRYAKRQRSWLRREPNAVLISGGSPMELIATVIGTFES